jgi:diguanylate cyclase (GGDEF)-like protein
LLYFDLDNFKKINDAFGHAFGDELLKDVADELKKTCKSQRHVSTVWRR